MLTKNQAHEAISKAHSHRHALRLIALGVLAAAIIAALLAHAGLLTTVDVAHAQNQTQAQGWEGPASSASSEVASAQAQGQVLITFDNIPIGATISNQYPQAMFSSDASNATVASDHFFGTSLPNLSRRNLSSWNCCNGYAPLVVDFPNPVNDLAFHILAADNFGTIAWVEVYQNNVWTTTQPVTGFGNPFNPIWYTGVSTYKNISRVRITAISDINGLAFDNFSFTIAPTPTPTPLPSPTPTPPPAPTNVNATPDENEIILSWTPSAGAASYVIKRTETISQSTEMAAATEAGSAFAAIASSVSCQPVNGRCFYEDTTAADSQVTYSYMVAATNSAGTSADSNPPASASPLSNACSAPTKTASPSAGPAGDQGWTMQWAITPNDGLVISEVYLNGKRMAKRMSVPYFRITTFKNGASFGPSRGELTPTSTGTGIRSRLVDYGQRLDNKKIQIYATYAVDRIPGTPKACLNVSQRYEFYRDGASPADLQGACEPSDTVHPCNKFRPMIDYNFTGGPGESLRSLNMPIRLHFQNTDIRNTVALTQDADNASEFISVEVPFKKVYNPLWKSWWSQVFVPKSVNPTKLAQIRPVDNLHQTNNKRRVVLPGVDTIWTPFGRVPNPLTARPAGCPECVHLHWRWAKFLTGPFGSGAPLLPPGSDQAVDIQINPYKGDEHPNDYYLNVFNPNDWLRNPTKDVNQPYDVVFWYSPTGFASHDTFFWHTAWFTPQIIQSPSNAASFSAEAVSSSTVQDGPVSVDFGAVYETGTTTFDSYDLSTMPPLPAGFAPLNNAGYLIDTTAAVAGPHVVNFKAESVTDQTDFNNLRIFYAEPDPFDPEKPMWIDATILSPDSPAPNFSAKTLSVRSEDLGVFVIGKLVQTPPPLGTANLRLSCTDSQDPITAGEGLTYTVTVTNDGPQAATEVMLRNPLSPDVEFVSTTPSQGTCKELNGEIYCSLNSLASGASATLSLLVKPTEGTASFPAEGKMVANSAVVRAKELDSDPSNDSVSEGTRVLPSPNKPPTIAITSPASGAMFVGPLNLTISAQASDTDGTITRVDFYDNDELIGNSTSGNPYSITKINMAYGPHELMAVATDNGGRQNAATVDVIVNGSANVAITSPSPSSLFASGSTITVAANASSSSGISKVEFFANGGLIGVGPSFAWNNVSAGIYSIVAVATDGSGITTTSTPINITVDTPPTVTMATPANGTVFPSLTNISVSAMAQSAHGTIVRVDFYANDVLIASSSDVGTDRFTATWRHLQNGFYSLKAVATDNLGVSTTSSPITIGVDTTSQQPGEFIWFDDALPAGAVKHADGDVDWYWVDANPGSFSGTKSHQSRSFGQLEPPNSFHEHSFEGATAQLPINAGDSLFTYVFIDPNDMPREIMLQWKDASGWEHRAYWGENRINLGINGTSSRYYRGQVPVGMWFPLVIPASYVGLEGSTVTGMKFSVDGGRATFDLTGKWTANAVPPLAIPPGDFVWIEDGLPAGAVPNVIDDQWRWVPGPTYSGQSAHQSFFNSSDNKRFRSHSFTGAQTPMKVNPGDVLFTYVYLGDPDLNHSNPHMPDQIMLQWYDGTSWNHRAYWGTNYIDKKVPNMGVLGTEGQRYMGGLPPSGRSGGCGIPDHPGWCRLEVPASYVGLEGKTVSGMAFSVYREGQNPFVTWDRSGKTAQPTAVPLPLSATIPVSKFNSQSRGYAFETNELPPPEHSLQRKDVFVVHPNQAAGTVPMYRFRRPTNFEYFYATNRELYDGTGWQFEGIAFYVYPDASTPGTVPLYLYHDTQWHYVLTTDYNEAISFGMNNFDGTWAYVYSEPVPVAPTASPGWNVGCEINWRDNSGNESGFKVYRWDHATFTYQQHAVLEPNTTRYVPTCGGDLWLIRAYNSGGISRPAGACTYCMVMDDPPMEYSSVPSIGIASPADGDVVGTNFPIIVNAFDRDGNGTIVRVEFFADGNKIGETTNAPHTFPWTNAPAGLHSLTAKASDAGGNVILSSTITVTVSKLHQSIAFESIPDKTYGDAPFGLNASASSGLPVTFAVVSGPATVSGNSVTITGAGIITVRASQSGDTNYNAADVDVTFNVAKASAAISLSNLNQTFDGSAKTAAASTTPNGLSGVSITYNGSATAPTNAGSYAVVASLTNSNYSAANATGTLSVAKASATISLYNLSHVYDGTAKNAIASTNPAGLSGVVITYNGSSTPPTNAGSYAVVASLLNANYTAADVAGPLTISTAVPATAAAHWKFDEGTGTTASDSTGNGSVGTLSNATRVAGRIGSGALDLNGSASVNVTPSAALANVSNNFTVSFWAYPRSTHEIDAEGYWWGGVSGQRYAVGALYHDPGAGAGVSVGTNGVSVYEHSANYMPALLVWQGSLTGWTHIAVVYENRQPKLYINGTLVRTGITSYVNPVRAETSTLGSGSYGSFDGKLDDVRIYNGPLTAGEIGALLGNQPFAGAPIAIPGRIEAEDFDDGGEGVAYHDSDSVNTFINDVYGTPNGPPIYRDHSVDIHGIDGNRSNGHVVGYTFAGEWLKYTVNVATADAYKLEVKYASAVYGGTFHIEVDGVDVTGTLTFASTGSWGNYVTLTKSNVILPAGQHVLRLVMDSGGSWGFLGTVDYLEFEREQTP